MSTDTKVIGAISIASLIILAGGVFFLNKSQTNTNTTSKKTIDVTSSCVRHGGLGMHIHPHITIKILSKEQKIPANIGIVSSICMRPIHTHDETGTLHLEFPRQTDVKLSEFFKVWRKTFSREQILDYKADENHTIKVIVNGQKVDDFENIIMRDRDNIEIRYE